jgi:hypothetical protein
MRMRNVVGEIVCLAYDCNLRSDCSECRVGEVEKGRKEVERKQKEVNGLMKR